MKYFRGYTQEAFDKVKDNLLEDRSREDISSFDHLVYASNEWNGNPGYAVDRKVFNDYLERVLDVPYELSVDNKTIIAYGVNASTSVGEVLNYNASPDADVIVVFEGHVKGENLGQDGLIVKPERIIDIIGIDEIDKYESVEKFSKGGLTKGPSHEDGGIPVMLPNGMPGELEGNEGILKKSAMESSEQHSLSGTPCEIASELNQKYGGVKFDCDDVSSGGGGKFADGGKVPESMFDEDCEYYVRFSAHINSDLGRGWSSWNFGQDGFKGTEEELEEAKSTAIENDQPFGISGIELWDRDIKNADIRELYEGYWVLVDNVNGQGVAGHCLPARIRSVEEALNEIKSHPGRYDGTGDGDFFSTDNARVIYSEEPEGEWGMHIIEVGVREFADGGVTPELVNENSRFRPKETIYFEPPIKGPSGAELTSYTWRWNWEAYVDREGEEKNRRVSDWSQAETSADTGRDIVHQFTVKTIDGVSHVVSSESVLILLGYAVKEKPSFFPALTSAVKTLAKLKMKLAIEEDRQKYIEESWAKVKLMSRPEITRSVTDSGTVLWRMGDEEVWDRSKEATTISEERLSVLVDSWERATVKKEFGVDPYRRSEVYELKNKVEKQQKKVNLITSGDKFADGGVIVTDWEMPDPSILKYGLKLKKDHPEIWDAGGNIRGNESFEALLDISERGYWLKSEEDFYKRWQSFKARHQHNNRLPGIIANIKWASWGNIGKESAQEIIEGTKKFEEGGKMPDSALEGRLKSYLSKEGGALAESKETSDIVQSTQKPAVKKRKKYARGGKVADWKKAALKALKAETGDKKLKDGRMDMAWGGNDDGFYAVSPEAEYMVFKSENDANYYANQYVEDMIDSEPELFSAEWLGNHYYVSDTDKRIIADEEATIRMEDEGLTEDDEDYQGKYDAIYDEWYNGLDKDPVHFLTEEQGLYSKEDLGRINFLQIDSREAARDAVNTDGVAHFISTYDGNEINLDGGYVAYRIN